MPVTKGSAGKNMYRPNNKKKREIEDDIADKIGAVSEIMRTADSIKVSDTFHLDAKFLKSQNVYKVEVQLRKPPKTTASIVLVAATLTDTPTNLTNLRKAINDSADDGHIYSVT